MPMDWPTSLPQQFSSNGYNDAFADNRQNTNPELGPALIRSRVSSMPRRVTGVMVMNKTQLDRLRQFWKVDTLDGKLPFLFPDPVFGYGWRRNYIYNSGYGGAVIGSPGTIPTGWGITGTTAGITRAVSGMGVENGLQYVDIHLSGTATGGSSSFVFTSSPYTVAAASNETWNGSVFLRMVAGNKNNITQLGSYIYDQPFTVSALNNVLNALSSVTLTSQRYSHKRTLPAAGVTGVGLGIYIIGKASSVVDITLRVGGPMLEKFDEATAFIQTPNTSRPITRFAAGGRPPQPSFLGGRMWSATLELEIFET